MVGPDESTGHGGAGINNDIFVNAVFVHTLESTLDAAAKLGLPSRSEWRDAASKIKIGFFDDVLLHKEYDGYEGLPIGQTDTVLLGFPLQFDDAHRVWGGDKNQTRLNDIEYYGPRVKLDGSYMSAGHYVIAWLERPHRDLEQAASWFARGREKNYAPWRIWSEHDSNDGGAVNFITAGGMFLQSLMFGYAGLRFHDSALTFDPVLPPRVRAMKFRGLNYMDTEFDVVFDHSGARFSRRASGIAGQGVRLQQTADGKYWLVGEEQLIV